MLKNYRNVESCMTCKFCVKEGVQDDGLYYYCNLDKTLKDDYLTCGYPHKNTNIFREAGTWCSEHQIEGNGICDDYILNTQ